MRVDFSQLRLESGEGGLMGCFVLGTFATKHVVVGLCSHFSPKACAGGVLVSGTQKGSGRNEFVYQFHA